MDGPVGAAGSVPRRIVPSAVVLATILAVVGASATAGSPSSLEDRFPAARWIPVAGHRERLVGTDGAATTIEWARGTGFTVLQSGPVGLILAADSIEELAALELARAGWVTTGPDGVASRRGDELVAVTEAGVETRVSTEGEQFVVFSPPRLELPAGVRPGQVWRADGSITVGSGATTTGTLAYRLVASADPPADPAESAAGCIAVTLRETIEAEPESLTTRTWCPGAGIVRTSGAAGTWQPSAAPPIASSAWRTATEPPAWTTAAQWRRTIWSAARQPPLSLTPAVAPVLLPGDVVVYANETGQDLVAIGLRGDSPNADWHAHPGGDVTALAAFGDIVVAATTNRRLVAYGPGGEWLWAFPLADVSEAALTALDEDRLVVAGLDGTVTAVEVRTGARAWLHRMPNEVRRTPVVAGGRVYVLDQAGNLVSLGRDGSPLWTASAEMADSFTVAAGHVVLASAVSNRIVGFAVADGTESWRRSFPGAKDGLTAVSDGVVMRTSDGVVAVHSATGAELWRRPGPVHGLAGGGGYATVVGADAVELWDGDGRRVASWAHELGDLSSGAGTFVTSGDGTLAVTRGDRVVRLGAG